MKINREQLDWIASKSFRNCHAAGVDSILFDDTPGARIRAFICRPEHTLWRNDVGSPGLMSVGLHPHHCQIAIEPIFGESFNVITVSHGGWRRQLAKFAYQSAITGTEGKFLATGNTHLFRLYPQPIADRIAMNAADLHTIYVPKGEEAAWFVYEGVDDPEYQAHAWSDDNLAALDFSVLYQPMNVSQVEAAINKMGIEIIETVPTF